MYGPALGRWHSMDPAAQFASPYVGIGNNPVNMIDPNGMWSNNISGYNDYGGRHTYQHYMYQQACQPYNNFLANNGKTTYNGWEDASAWDRMLDPEISFDVWNAATSPSSFAMEHYMSNLTPNDLENMGDADLKALGITKKVTKTEDFWNTGYKDKNGKLVNTSSVKTGWDISV